MLNSSKEKAEMTYDPTYDRMKMNLLKHKMQETLLQVCTKVNAGKNMGRNRCQSTRPPFPIPKKGLSF